MSKIISFLSAGGGGGGGGGGVSDINGLTGGITIAAGSGIALSTSSSTITVHASGILRKAAADFSSSLSWTLVHNFGTRDVTVGIYDSSSFAIIPDTLDVSNVNQVTATFTLAQAGRMVVLG